MNTATANVNASHASKMRLSPLHGLLARFESAEELVAATKKAYVAGYRQMDAYSPVPVEGLASALGRQGTAMPLIMLLGGIVGGVSGFFMQWYSAVVDYPFNIGGRPFNSWVSFIPITFEATVLVSAISGVVGMLYLNGLPRYHHPIFNARGIERASVDGFFLCLESGDPKWDAEGTRRFLKDELNAAEVTEVAR